jgi:hypothetical protein
MKSLLPGKIKNTIMMYWKSTLKIILVELVILGVSQWTWAQLPNEIEPFAAPFGESNFHSPQFPNRSVNIVDFDAEKGGKFKNILICHLWGEYPL